jgi:hypothetical protein
VGIRVTRSRLRGDPDFTQAAVSALSRNSDDLTKLFGQVYGSARAGEFRRLWEAKQESLVEYARAVSQHDQAAKPDAYGGMPGMYPLTAASDRGSRMLSRCGALVGGGDPRTLSGLFPDL